MLFELTYWYVANKNLIECITSLIDEISKEHLFWFNIYLFEFNLMHMSQGDEAGRSNNLQLLDDDCSEMQPSKQKTQTLNKDCS